METTVKNKLAREFLNLNGWLYFGLVCLVYFLTSYVMSELIMTKEVYYNSMGEQVAIDRIDEQFAMREKWYWIGYLFIPFIILLKITYATICLNIGTLFADIKTGFSDLFKIVLLAEGIFVLASLTRTGWLYFIENVTVLHDVQFFFPLSLLNLFEPAEIPRWIVYPLQTLNLFELTYWFILALGLQWLLKKPFKNMFRLVLSSYGVGILIWMVFVVFLSINLS